MKPDINVYYDYTGKISCVSPIRMQSCSHLQLLRIGYDIGIKFLSDKENIDDYAVMAGQLTQKTAPYEIPQIDSRQAIQKKQKTNVLVSVMPQRIIVDFMIEKIPEVQDFNIRITELNTPNKVFETLKIPRERLLEVKTFIFPLVLFGQLSFYTNRIFDNYIVLR